MSITCCETHSRMAQAQERVRGAVSAERERIMRDVVRPLVEALERVERGGAVLADGTAVCMWCEEKPHMEHCPVGEALSAARQATEPAEKPCDGSEVGLGCDCGHSEMHGPGEPKR